MVKPIVFVHANEQQMLGAFISAYSFKKYSRHADEFDVRIIKLEETPHLYGREGQKYLRLGKMATWHNADLQSFSPLRMMVPQLMGFQGRAVVTDPDVFSVRGDIYELLTQDMGGKAVLARNLPEEKGGGVGRWATSVMVLDCAQLTDWQWDRHIDQMFAGELDYKPWSQLRFMDGSRIGELSEVWNSFDKLTEQTQLVHMTERSTQPWKTGLPINYNLNGQRLSGKIKLWLRSHGWMPQTRRKFQKHPDPAQEAFFFQMLKECLETGAISEGYLRQSIQQQDVRADAWDMLAANGYRPRLAA